MCGQFSDFLKKFNLKYFTLISHFIISAASCVNQQSYCQTGRYAQQKMPGCWISRFFMLISQIYAYFYVFAGFLNAVFGQTEKQKPKKCRHSAIECTTRRRDRIKME